MGTTPQTIAADPVVTLQTNDYIQFKRPTVRGGCVTYPEDGEDVRVYIQGSLMHSRW